LTAFCFSSTFFRFLPIFLASHWWIVGYSKIKKMNIQIRGRISRNGQKIWYSFESGKGPGERKTTGMFTYIHPKNEIQENYNKKILALLDTELTKMIIDFHSERIGSLQRTISKSRRKYN
jgi:hypothetical protein